MGEMENSGNDDITKVLFSSYDNCGQEPIRQEEFYNFDMSFKQCANHTDFHPEIESYMKLNPNLDVCHYTKDRDQGDFASLSNYLKNFNDKKIMFNGNMGNMPQNNFFTVNNNVIVQRNSCPGNELGVIINKFDSQFPLRKRSDDSWLQKKKKAIFQTKKAKEPELMDKGKDKRTLKGMLKKLPLYNIIEKLKLHLTDESYESSSSIFSEDYGKVFTGITQNNKESYNKRLKMVKNRISAKKCRQRKKEYLTNLENQVAFAKNELAKTRSSALVDDSSIHELDQSMVLSSFENFLTLLKQNMPNKFQFLDKHIFISSFHLSQNDQIDDFITNLNNIQEMVSDFYNLDVCKLESKSTSTSANVQCGQQISYPHQLYHYLASLQKLIIHFREFLVEAKKLEEIYPNYSDY